MTLNGIVGPMSKEEKVPDIIKQKLENFKIEAKLVNEKEINLGNYISVFASNICLRKPLKISVQILNYTSLENEPNIPRHGRLISEIFKIELNSNRKPETAKTERLITYKIMCSDLDCYCYPIVYNSQRWIKAEQYEIESDCIKIKEGGWNIITIIKESRYEILNIGRAGGLLYSKLDPLLSLRISKGNFKNEFDCKIQICNMSLDHLNSYRDVYEDQLSPYLNISDMTVIDIANPDSLNYDNQLPFRRPISVKLRLPDWVMSILENQNFDCKNIIKDQKKEKVGFYFLQKVGDTWNVVESNLKFTNNSIEFDIKYFGSFIFINCRENREIRLCSNLIIVESLLQSEKGVILTFLWVKTKKWFIWLEMVPVCKILETRSKFEALGFIFIEQTYDSKKIDESKRGKNNGKFSKSELVLQRKTFELKENIQFILMLSGELEISHDQIPQKPETLQIENNHTGIEDNNNGNSNKLSLEDFDKIGSNKRNSTANHEENQVALRFRPDLSYHQNATNSNSVIIPVNPINRSFAHWEKSVLNKFQKRSIYELSNPHQKASVESVNTLVNIQSDIEENLLEPSTDVSKFATRLPECEKDFHFYAELKIEPINFESFGFLVPTQLCRFHISLDYLKNYFQIKTKEEKQKEELEQKMIQEKIEREQKYLEEEMIRRKNMEIDDKPKQVDYNHLKGLAKPRYIKKAIDKEPKIISRRSFLALSSVIRQGLKLAVYLSIPDNAIAGIGFDALSQMSVNGSNNTTYKVLLLWKKMILLNKVKENVYVEQLIFGLKSIGYNGISELVHNKWLQNEEISVKDCEKCLLQNIF